MGFHHGLLQVFPLMFEVSAAAEATKTIILNESLQLIWRV
jgi:hypothetical protein